MNLGEFKREVEYLDPEMDLDSPPVESSPSIVFDTEPVTRGGATPLPAMVQAAVTRVEAVLSESVT